MTAACIMCWIDLRCHSFLGCWCRQASRAWAERQPPEVRPSDQQVPWADTEAEVLSNEVVEQQDLPEQGCFTAYADGRVSVIFADRTLLRADRQRLRCCLLLPDASRVEVSTGSSAGMEWHVRQALEFAGWAFSSPAERAAALRRQVQVQVQLTKCQVAAGMCHWAASSSEQCSKHNEDLGTNPPASFLAGADVASDTAAADASMTSMSSCHTDFCDDAGPLTGSEREAIVDRWLSQNATVLSHLSTSLQLKPCSLPPHH